MPKFILIILLLCSKQLTAQGGKIHSKQLRGDWQSADSSTHRILFKDKGPDLQLIFAPYSEYSFRKDSTGFIDSSGILIRWPPQYCILRLISNDEIELYFTDFTGRQYNRGRYRKLEGIRNKQVVMDN